MTREDARIVLRRMEAGLLTAIERAQLIDCVLAALLRAALESPDGRVSFQLNHDETRALFSPLASPRVPA